MIVFRSEEQQNTSSKRCKLLTSILKVAFSNCHTYCGTLSCSSHKEEYNHSVDDEQEVFVSTVLSGYMEAKARRKGNLNLESLCWQIDLPLTSKTSCDFVEERDDFFSVGSSFSRSSSATDMEAFLSVKTNLSSCSSLSFIEYLDLQSQRKIIEFCYCEGWPFGLYRKALLLPPLPKSPSESWSWRKSKSTQMTCTNT